MGFNIDTLVDDIMRAGTDDLHMAEALWLDGIKTIISDVRLNPLLTRDYVFNIDSKFPKYTPMLSSIIIDCYGNSICNGTIFPADIPIDKDRHLRLWLIRDDADTNNNFSSKSMYKFMHQEFYVKYTDKKACDVYDFPIVELKLRVDFSDDELLMNSILEGFCVYDTTMYIGKQKKDVIYKTYNAIGNLLKFSKKSDAQA